MIKANATKPRASALEIEAEDIGVVADYLTRASDIEHRRKEERVASIQNNIRDCGFYVERRRGEIADYEQEIEKSKSELGTIEHEIANLPPTRTITLNEARADIQRALALPFVENIAIERIDDKVYIVATTRNGVLTTTLKRKFSRAEKWYRVKPYKLALPTYKIRIGTALRNSITQHEGALGLALANPKEDTGYFLDWIGRYSHEPHAHWGTPIIRSEEEKYYGICLGEFEHEVSKAVRTSIADALIAVSIYLQSAGTPRAYVHKREEWALWLGKKAYNFAIIPSEKEDVINEAEDDDNEAEDDDNEAEDYDENTDQDDNII